MVKAPNHISRRGLMLGALSIGVAGWSGIAAGGTMTWFRDVESSDNVIEAGTLKLDLGSSSGIDLEKDLEKDHSTSGTVTLMSSGSVRGWLDVDVKYFQNSGDPDEVAKNLTVETLKYGSNDLLKKYDNINNLYELANNEQNTNEDNDLVDLADPTPDGTDFTIKLTRKNSSGNLDGDSIDVEFVFYLNQTDAM